MSILRELFFGEISPLEDLHPSGEIYRANTEMALVLETELLTELNEKGKEAYNKYTAVQSKIVTEQLCDSFCDGVRLGIQLMLAATSEKQNE